ncbi:MAG: hypothetical protein ABIS06_13800 [Vicinamibacterales bacterium]
MPIASLLDHWMPSYDVVSRHELRCRASPARVYEAARTLDLGASTLVRLLVGIRAIPGVIGHVLFTGSNTPTPSSTSGRRVGRIPFTLLAEDPGREFVFGLMGQFWTPTGRIVKGVTAETFRSPPMRGTAQAMWNFRIEPCEAGSRLLTETRVRCADDDSRRQFLRYWRVVRIGSSITRWSMLRQIRSRAERGA